MNTSRLKLKLSTTKTVSAVFHLNNKEAKRELKVNFNNETLPFCSEPKYLGVMLDRLLTYRWHLESLCKKLTSHVALLRWLAGSVWGAVSRLLRTATLALVHSTAEYCAPVWCHSAHTRLINDALWIVTGCLRPAPADNLPILAGIQPAALSHNGTKLSLGHVPWSLDTFSTQRSPVYRVQMHGASNRDTHLYLQHNNSSVFLTTTTYMLWTGWITNGMRNGWTAPQDSAFSFQTPLPTLPELPFQEELGSGSTASALVSGVSSLLVQMGYSLLCGLWVWRRRTNRRPCPPMSNPLTSSWTTRPDGSGWWDNRMAARHCPEI